MKKKIVLLWLACALTLGCTACGSGYGTSDSYVGNSSYGGAEVERAESDYSNGDYDYGPDASLDDSGSQLGTGQARDISKEMLVYTCDMTIDVLDFDEAVAAFQARLGEFGGFVESEEYSDNGSVSRYYDRKAEVWHRYVARVRIPSRRYEDFCSGVSAIGDLRSKSAHVENLSQEYSDAKTALAIYEAKQERYLALLSTIQDDEYALKVEQELTDLEITIAKLRTRMSQIETDVAYSYVNVTINEVKEYRDEPLRTDTFGQRLGNVLGDTWAGFLNFLEALLFFLIHVFPYLLILIVVLAICKVLKLTDRIRDKYDANRQKKREREARRAQEQQLRYQQWQQNQQNQQSQMSRQSPGNGQKTNDGEHSAR